MRLHVTRPEQILLLAGAGLLLAALLAPALAQPAHAHAFADQRTLWGIPCALDVLSNLGFALAGALGLLLLARAPRAALGRSERACAGLFFAGLVVTAAGSSWYHFSPNDAGLAIDRAAMGVAFAGLLGVLAATHASGRAGCHLARAVLVLAPVSAWVCLRTGNVLPWALVQFGGIALVLLVLATCQPRAGALPVRWGAVLVAYGIAKLFEMNDAWIFQASGELFSGHTLKHVAASFAAGPLLVAVGRHGAVQNGRQAVAQAA